MDASKKDTAVQQNELRGSYDASYNGSCAVLKVDLQHWKAK
jgi:hypothetical protein